MIQSVLHMRKTLWSKLRSSFAKEGRHRKEEVSSLLVRTNVNHEYKEAFRTKSYTEICNKFRGQLQKRICLDEGKSSSSTPMEQIQLSEDLVEPHQETLISILEGSKYRSFLENYLDMSLEDGRICEFILQNIHQVRVIYHSIRNVINLIDLTPDYTNWSRDQYNWPYTTFSSHGNPFSAIPQEKFYELHNSHVELLHQLTSKYRKTKRRTKFIRCIKRALAIVGCGALAIALLVLALHSMVGAVIAAPGLIICTLVVLLIRKWKGKQMEGVGAELDIAARGVYTLINDFDTISRLVERLRDEMEHRKFVAEICVRKGKSKILKQVAREFQMQEFCFQEQLEELEKQIYLSFLDINRSRRLLLQEMDK